MLYGKEKNLINNSLYIERFNRTYRDAILNMYVLKTLNEVRELTEVWVKEYKDERPHDSLGNLTPWKYLSKSQQRKNSNFECHYRRDIYIWFNRGRDL